MRAALYLGQSEPFRIEELPDPAPAPGEIVLRVSRCGICSSDVHMTSPGGYGFPPRSVLGHEFCGQVVEIGRGVDSVRVGDRVTAMPFLGCGRCGPCRGGDPGWCAAGARGAGFGSAPGAYAQYVAVSAQSSVVLPGGVSDALGALVEPLAVAFHGVRRAAVGAGARVAVIGAGPIGLSAALWAREAGATRIAVIARSSRKADLALRMGADHLLTEDDALDDALGGAPDLVFECVGQPGLLGRAVAMVAPRGHVVMLGFCTHPDRIDHAACLLKEITIAYSKTYALADYVAVIDALARGIDVPAAMVSRTEPLDRLPGLFDALRTGLSDCKIHIDPWA